MNRSVWKIPFVNNELLRSSKRISDKPISSWARNSLFVYPHLNKTFKIYNGRKFVSVQVKKTLLGHYSGDFCMSKFLGRKIHLRKKKKKQLQKK